MARTRAARGFSLLEILIVVALIAGFVMVVGARIGGGFGIAITSSGRVVAAELRTASQRAVATGRVQRWVLDLESQAFRLEERIEVIEERREVREALYDLLRPPRPSIEFVPVGNKRGGWRWLDEEEVPSVLIDGVQTRDEFVDRGEITIAFAPDGGADLAIVHLSDSHGNRLGVRIDPFTGSVRTIDGDRLDDEQLLDVPPGPTEAETREDPDGGG